MQPPAERREAPVNAAMPATPSAPSTPPSTFDNSVPAANPMNSPVISDANSGALSNQQGALQVRGGANAEDLLSQVVDSDAMPDFDAFEQGDARHETDTADEYSAFNELDNGLESEADSTAGDSLISVAKEQKRGDRVESPVVSPRTGEETAGRNAIAGEGALIAEQRMINGLPFNVYLRKMAMRAQAMKQNAEGPPALVPNVPLNDEGEARAQSVTMLEEAPLIADTLLGGESQDDMNQMQSEQTERVTAEGEGEQQASKLGDGAAEAELELSQASEAAETTDSPPAQDLDGASRAVEGMANQDRQIPELMEAAKRLSQANDGGSVALGQRFDRLEVGDELALSLEQLTGLAKENEDSGSVSEVSSALKGEDELPASEVIEKPYDSLEPNRTGDGMKVATTLGDVILGNVVTDPAAQRAIMVDNKNFSSEISRLVTSVETLFYQAEGQVSETGGTALEEGVSLQLRGDRFKHIGDATLKCHLENGKLAVMIDCEHAHGVEYLSEHYEKLIAELTKRFADAEISLMINGLEVAGEDSATLTAEIVGAQLQSDAGGTSGGRSEASALELLGEQKDAKSGDGEHLTASMKRTVGSGLFGRVSASADADSSS
jgi:hypothetical protein